MCFSIFLFCYNPYLHFSVRSGDCDNPCVVENPCATRAECVPFNHLAHCRCPIGYTGEPYLPGGGCVPIAPPECVEDGDCDVGFMCLLDKCGNPCEVNQPCEPYRGSESSEVGSLCR